MTTLCLILGDQLSLSLSSLRGLNKQSDIILLCEVMEEASYVPHHPQKIAFLFSAMRHFANSLTAQGFRVRYTKLDDPQNSGSFDAEVKRALIEEKATALVVTEAGEWRVMQKLEGWQEHLAVEVSILPDDRFLASHADFAAWASDKKQLRMEFFYREMRRKYNILIEEDGTPTGGSWNYDRDNRKPPKNTLRFPSRLKHVRDEITADVLKLVGDKFSHHFGSLEAFDFAATTLQAEAEAAYFFEHMLADFGTYQDAMLAGEPLLYHSRLSAYLNAGLLLPLDICRLAERAYEQQKAPLNAVEGFIRQILGWREFMRGTYWRSMPGYATLNGLNASRHLPAVYWGHPTRMFCMGEVVRHTKEYAYSHHIQRLMVTGNFALLAGLAPAEVCAWYLAVYADAYEWVELPNTLGMALHGDHGAVGSKPYAASGKYIDRMSNFCKKCSYDPKETVGENACPFNALYWDFLVRHQDTFRHNQRMAYVYIAWDKMTPERQTATRSMAATILQRMENDQL